MPRFRVTLAIDQEARRDPTSVALVARFHSASDRVATLDRQAERPSLVLQVQDAHERPILLPPPPLPDEAQKPHVVQPGEAIQLRYTGFLDRDLPDGTYRVRYLGVHESLGGDADGPLRSEWLALEVRSDQRYAKGRPLRPVELIARAATRSLLARIACFLIFAFRVLWCAILRILDILTSLFGGRRRCQSVYNQEFDVLMTQTISDAPAPFEAYNGTYGWRARFHLAMDEPACAARVTVRLRTSGDLTAAQRSAWEAAIEGAWNEKFKLCCGACCCPNGFQLSLDVQWVTSTEHQVVTVGDTTTSMNAWGASDTLDVPHEVGHMIGAFDEYFTVNGLAWGDWRQANGAIMNNPANPPAERNCEVVRASAAALLGCSFATVAVSRLCC